MSNGLPYFPLDTNLDDSFELIEAEFGVKGFAIVVKLLQKIYGGKGYYCEWSKDVGLLFSKKINEGYGLVSEIVNAAVRRGIFDSVQFEKNKILTSEEIQTRYLNAVSRRKEVLVQKTYLLVNAVQKYSNVHILNENDDILPKNDNIPKQRKEKERKEKESKVNRVTDLRSQEYFKSFWERYPRKQAKMQAQNAWLNLQMTDELFEKIMRAIERQKKSVQWTQDNGRYIPNPATWLNQERWNDDLPPLTEDFIYCRTEDVSEIEKQFAKAYRN